MSLDDDYEQYEEESPDIKRANKFNNNDDSPTDQSPSIYGATSEKKPSQMLSLLNKPDPMFVNRITNSPLAAIKQN